MLQSRNDTIKQLGFYSDTFKKGVWSEPEAVIDEGLTDLPLDYVRKFVIGG